MMPISQWPITTARMLAAEGEVDHPVTRGGRPRHEILDAHPHAEILRYSRREFERRRHEGSGPWPEPDEADEQTAAHAEAQQLGEDAAAVAADLDTAGDRIVDHLDEIDDQVSAWDERTDASGSKGIASRSPDSTSRT